MNRAGPAVRKTRGTPCGWVANQRSSSEVKTSTGTLPPGGITLGRILIIGEPAGSGTKIVLGIEAEK